MKIYWLTLERLSEIIGVTTRRLSEVCTEAKNREPDSSHYRKYNLVKSIKLYLENLQVEKMDYATQIKKLDMELKQHKLDVAKENYIDTSIVETAFEDILLKTKTKLNNLPGKVSSELLEKSSRAEVEEILKQEIQEVLEELSNFNFEINEE